MSLARVAVRLGMFLYVPVCMYMSVYAYMCEMFLVCVFMYVCISMCIFLCCCRTSLARVAVRLGMFLYMYVCM
jgi:hypothetical protein